MFRTLVPFILAASLVLEVRATTYFVDASRPNDDGIATNWSTAKQTIQAAVNLTVANDTVLVTSGVYNTGTTLTPGYTLSNRVMITNNITVRSVSGPGETFVEGSGTNWYNTSSAVRCVFMSRGVLDGFTLRYGTTKSSANSVESEGGGINMNNSSSSALATNCVITECLAAAGGGSSGGKLIYCILSSNCGLSRGGGASGGTLHSCILVGNRSMSGGAAYHAALNSCQVIGNSATSGGGSCGGTLCNCLLVSNDAYEGGGAYAGSLTNCTLSGNTVTTKYGGGGSLSATLNNCVVWGNTTRDGEVNNVIGNKVYYTCHTPKWPGEGNIDTDPCFVATNDYHLASHSPCVNAGMNARSAGIADIDGSPRISDGTVDMGAYEYGYVDQPEFSPPSGSIITNSLAIIISCHTEGATIRYTIDGSNPKDGSPIYDEPINISTTTTFRATARKLYMGDSPVSVATYLYYRRGTIMLCY